MGTSVIRKERGATALPHLTFDGKRIPLTAPELELLRAALVDHVERTGTHYGFIRALVTDR